MANVPLCPQLFLPSADKIPEAEASPSIPCHPLHPCATTGATISFSGNGLISLCRASAGCLRWEQSRNGGALLWVHPSLFSRYPCLMAVFPCSGGSHLASCVLSALLPGCWRVHGCCSLPERLQHAPAAGSAWLETDN